MYEEERGGNRYDSNERAHGGMGYKADYEGYYGDETEEFNIESDDHQMNFVSSRRPPNNYMALR